MLRRAAILLIASVAIALGSNLVEAIGGTSPRAMTSWSSDLGSRVMDAVDVPGVARTAPGGVVADPVAAPIAVAAPIPVAAGTDEEGRLPIGDRLAFWTARVERDPTDHVSMVQLAGLEAQEARRTSDVDRFRRADALLDRALAIDPLSFNALRAKAGVRFALHDFQGAMELADRVLAIAAGDVGAMAIDADARLETGDLVNAGTEYEQLATLVPGPAVDARRARHAYLVGDDADALRLATDARDTARRLERIDDPAFYHYQLAELARLTGDADLARGELRAGLAIAPDDTRLLLSEARLEAATDEVDDAIAALEHATAIVPSPESLALLGDLQALAGDQAGAQAAHATVDGIGQLAAAAGGVYDRQLALFALDHGRGDPALVTRLRDALRDRPDAYGHDLLAWALFRSGQLDAAADEAEAALSNGIHDARILYHAGAIAMAAGETETGRAWLIEAMARATALAPSEIADATKLLDSLP